MTPFPTSALAPGLASPPLLQNGTQGKQGDDAFAAVLEDLAPVEIGGIGGAAGPPPMPGGPAPKAPTAPLARSAALAAAQGGQVDAGKGSLAAPVVAGDFARGLGMSLAPTRSVQGTADRGFDGDATTRPDDRRRENGPGETSSPPCCDPIAAFIAAVGGIGTTPTPVAAAQNAAAATSDETPPAPLPLKAGRACEAGLPLEAAVAPTLEASTDAAAPISSGAPATSLHPGAAATRASPLPEPTADATPFDVASPARATLIASASPTPGPSLRATAPSLPSSDAVSRVPAVAVPAMSRAQVGASPAERPSSNDDFPETPTTVAGIAFETHLGFSPGSAARPLAAAAPVTRSRSEPADASSVADPAASEPSVSGDAPADGTSPAFDAATEAASGGHGEPAQARGADQTAAAPDLVRGVGDPALRAPAFAPAIAARAAKAVAALASTATASAEGEASPSRGAPARSMVLQLAPEGLGTLSVRLHVAGRALDVRLDASDSATASLLDAHRDTLAVALGDEGYSLQTLTIGTQDAALRGGTHAARFADTGAARSGSSDGSAGGSSGGDGAGRRARDQGDRRQASPRRHDDLAVARRGSSALFV